MNIRQIPIGPYESNCYLIWDEDLKGIVIDPGADAEIILQAIDEEGLEIIGYPFTHGHYDHICAADQVMARHPAPACMHPADLKWAFSDINQAPPFYLQPATPPVVSPGLEEGSEMNYGGLRFKCLHTPGHSPGCVCFYFEKEKILIAGDTLFQGSIGRTDLPGGDMNEMTNSLRRLHQLPDDLQVYCGHGPATLLGHEKQTNPFMRQVG